MNGLLKTYGQNKQYFANLLSPNSQFSWTMRKLWAQEDDINLFWWDFESSEKWQQIIQRYISNLLSRSWSSNQREYSLSSLTGEVQERTAQNLNTPPPYDDY